MKEIMQKINAGIGRFINLKGMLALRNGIVYIVPVVLIGSVLVICLGAELI
ncbi:MAG: S10 family peptidase [Bifidobacteriaceae bacterium]|jgi:cellobiose-specific phosphotransferase system component IIC|nr:S10 family peptidase [Bifidobacteriaceae bacterium]